MSNKEINEHLEVLVSFFKRSKQAYAVMGYDEFVSLVPLDSTDDFYQVAEQPGYRGQQVRGFLGITAAGEMVCLSVNLGGALTPLVAPARAKVLAFPCPQTESGFADA